MALFKVSYTKELPADAEIVTKKGTRYARVKGTDGRMTLNKLSTSGLKMLVPAKKWTGEYRDANGNIRRKTLFSDKEASKQELARLVKEAELGQAGVIDKFAEHRKRPIVDHLTDFIQNLRDRGNTDAHVKLVNTRIRKIIDGCEFLFPDDLDAVRVENFLADEHRPKQKLKPDGTVELVDGMSLQTCKHYVRAIKSFTAWLAEHRLDRDPLKSLKPRNPETDLRHVRRAFTVEELRKLCEAAKRSGPYCGFDGETRVTIYMAAAYTGLRASELASLTPERFDFSDDPVSVTVEARSSKRRRKDVLPLFSGLVTMLRPIIDRTKAGTRLWAGNWAKNKRAGVMLQRDLEAAGIPYEDEEGRVLDFHSLRATTATLLARAGVPLTVAQKILRHSDPKLTANVYSKLELMDLSAGIESLPEILVSPPEEKKVILRATGTDSQHVGPHVGVCDSLRAPVSLPEQMNMSEQGQGQEMSKGPETADLIASEPSRASMSHTEQAERGGFFWDSPQVADHKGVYGDNVFWSLALGVVKVSQP